MSWKYYNIFYISSKSSNLYPNNASHLHLFFLNDQKKDAIVVLASQTVDKVPVFAGTFTMSTVFLV